MAAWAQELAAFAAIACAAVWLGLRWARDRRTRTCSDCLGAASPSPRAGSLPIVRE